MSGPFRIFVGFDPKETVSFHVLNHSILKRASIPVSVTPLSRANLRDIYTRVRTPLESTDFSLSRFLVPALCDYKGWALFMDCDMLCKIDVAELASYCNLGNWYKSVYVCNHEYQPKTEKKFLDNQQTRYKCKNWSSVMLFNNERCKTLTPEYVHGATGLALHQFHWTTHDQIGALPLAYNWLVGEYEKSDEAKIVHFTLGGPYFSEYEKCDYADDWWAEWKDMTYCEQRSKVSSAA